MDPEQARAAWTDVAEAYERQAMVGFAGSVAVTEWLIDAVAPGPGMTVLDVAAGPGLTSLELAARGARVICSDNAPGMVELARKNAAARDLDGIRFAVLDAMAMDLPDDAADAVVCRFGMMLMPDPSRAFGEVRRVLTSGGPFAYAVWAPQTENIWAGLIGEAGRRAGHELPGDPTAPGGMFSLADPERNRRVLSDAGFDEVHTELIPFPVRFPSFEDYWSMRVAASTTTQALLASMSSEEADAVKAEAAALAAGHIEADGALAFGAIALGVRAR